MNLRYIGVVFFSLILINSCRSGVKKAKERTVSIPSFYLVGDSIQKISWDKKHKAYFQFNPLGDTLQVKAKYRGGSSSKYPKHSLTVQFKDELVLNAGWKKDDDYIFNANYADKSLVRHRLSYDLFRSFSPANLAPKTCFRNLYINNDFRGLYLITEEVDRSFLGIKKKDSTAIILKDGALFNDYYKGYPKQDGEDVFQQKYPKKQTDDNRKEIIALWNLIHTSNDVEFRSSILNYFDINNIIDFHLLLLLTNNGDGVVKNFYWYKKEGSRWKFVPWDYDDSFGRNGDGTRQNEVNHLAWERNALLKRLFELNIDNYRKKLKTKWFSLREKGLGLDKIKGMIAEYYAELVPQDVENHFKKWPIDDPNHSDSMSYKEELELIYTYIPKKLTEIDSLTTLWVNQINPEDLRP